MSKELEAFVRLEHSSKRYKGRKEDLDIIFTALHEKNNLERKLDEYALALKDRNNKLKALEVVKECVGLKMSVDEDVGCLYVPITKCFQPLEQNIVVVGYVKGKDKIDLLKEVLL